jgi:hypothetical protein
MKNTVFFLVELPPVWFVTALIPKPFHPDRLHLVAVLP